MPRDSGEEILFSLFFLFSLFDLCRTDMQLTKSETIFQMR